MRSRVFQGMGKALIEALRQKCAWCVQRISKEWVWDRGSHWRGKVGGDGRGLIGAERYLDFTT